MTRDPCSNSPAKRLRATTMALAGLAFGAGLIISDVAQATCHWQLTGRIIRSDPLPTDNGDIVGPGYSIDVMTMARWTNGALCPGGECPFNTTNWVQSSTNGDGEFVITSLPHAGPSCHVERDFVFMIQGEKADISSWQTVENRNGIDGPEFPGPSPVFVHEVNIGDIKVDDLAPPEGYAPPHTAPDIGTATMEPADTGTPNLAPGTIEAASIPGSGLDTGSELPDATIEANPNPFPPGNGAEDDATEEENTFPDVTIEANPNPFPSGDVAEDEGETLPDVTIVANTDPFPTDPSDPSGNDDPADAEENDENDNSGFGFPDAQFEEAGCQAFNTSGLVEQADFAFGPHPGEGHAHKSPDGLIRIQQRQTGGNPMARRLSVTFEVQNHGERHQRRVGDCPVEILLRLNEGPDMYGDSMDAWHSYDDPIPTINANWQRFVTMSATTRGTGNDTNSSWNEGYEYVRIQVVLDHTNGVNEANEGDNIAGEYCYHATTNRFVDMGTCDAAAAEFD